MRVAKTRYRKGEPIELTVSTSLPGYVYCYVQSPTTGKIQRRVVAQAFAPKD